MSIQYEIQILRSKLIAMTRLTQRTVDYSIKAFQLGRPDLCRAVQNSKEEMSAIRGWIANHGRALLATRTLSGADSRFICAALRISTALEAICYSAFNVARHSSTRLAEGWMPVSAELDEAGNYVCRLLRLCILSLVKGDVLNTKAVLQNGIAGQSFDLAVYLTHHDLAQRINPDARFELVLIRCLDAIAGQVREIADALLQWQDGIEPKEVADDGAAHQTLALAREVVIPWQRRAETVTTDDFAQARLIGLQQRVCELLVKNQQLRMALIAERAETHHDQLC